MLWTEGGSHRPHAGGQESGPVVHGGRIKKRSFERSLQRFLDGSLRSVQLPSSQERLIMKTLLSLRAVWVTVWSCIEGGAWLLVWNWVLRGTELVIGADGPRTVQTPGVCLLQCFPLATS